MEIVKLVEKTREELEKGNHENAKEGLKELWDKLDAIKSIWDYDKNECKHG